MAKPLGPKSRLIREAIKAHPNLGNTELAELVNGADARQKDQIEVSASDIAAQKKALQKAGEAGAAATDNGGTTEGKRPAAAPASTVPPKEPRAAPTLASPASPVDLIDSVLHLARQCGGFEQLRRLVDRIAEMQGL